MKTTQKGFTLIELLVVIAIIGMLSSIVLASLNSARSKSRDSRRLEDMRSLANAVVISETSLTAAFAGCTGADVRASTCSTPDLSKYSDPSGVTTPCTSTSAAQCDYSVSEADGGAGANFNDWQVCGYLENAAGTLSAGRVSVSSSDYSISAGCN